MGEAISVRAAGLAQQLAARARARVATVAEGADTMVEAVRVRLTALRPNSDVLAQVAAEVDGRRVRVQRIAASAGTAMDALVDGLRERITESTAPWRPRPWPPRAPEADQPIESEGGGLIGRVKRPELVWCEPDAAVRTLDAMDYDVHLFVDPDTEAEAVVYRTGPTGYRLARTVTGPPPPARRGLRLPASLTISPHVAPRLTAAEALRRLYEARLPFLFYADPDTGRGRVLYRRFAGDCGLITG
ncbi:MAG: hypothetical protein HOV68_29400 [Streptomycetaceae bacterium]|nr:hypothetical protein [Streptomycetaceae bacterium]